MGKKLQREAAKIFFNHRVMAIGNYSKTGEQAMHVKALSENDESTSSESDNDFELTDDE